MDVTSREALVALVNETAVAALGTLHDGFPFVSMVPFALSVDGRTFYVHVSGLAQHTQDMIADPRVGLLVTESEETGTPPQALARLSVQGRAREIPRDSTEYGVARGVYLRRFPDTEPMFGLPDFSLFAITPLGARFIGGFARAFSLTPEELAAMLVAHQA
jgi:putative heme iron utilization protein